MVDHNLLSKPPLNLLINPEVIRKKKPWELDILQLLEIFISLIDSSESPDLRLCGTALVSSALMYRLKVEALFFFEKLKVKRKTPKIEEPPFFDMPFRFELYSTSLDELISILEQIIKNTDSKTKKEKSKQFIEPEPILEVDPFFIHIKDLLSSFRSKLLNELQNKDEISFNEVIQGMQHLEALKSFILLLFLATEGIIILEQVNSDIKIKRETQYIND